jgi:hypothetical protein
MLNNPRWDKTKLEPWRRLLPDGADLIEQRGHVKDRMEDASGRLCVVAAVYKASGGRSKLAVPALAHLDRHLGRRSEDFNNDPETTAADVVAEMRAAAAL